MRSIYPVFRYTDAKSAIDWLVDAFGFERTSVSEGPDGTVAHAELTHGTGMVMVSQRQGPVPAVPDADDWRVYLAVDDVDAHHARAVAAGAEVIMPLTDQPYGSREYGARDLEGNCWSFGTYRP
ncbi:VOC family protein [Phytohabitans houttuyneae]|uniref:VOC domain-containing protein n=1 Tax=Phytohabitans houttuyneae TaxID=1076126 RepID=A0A6V8JVX6_9ACTN|nr:VOC family protein [Phytohabitans houttuyneae]GFJ76772.1 hypothetical protein Phou_009520 [Phytohabitans houttuyneae]